MARKATMMPMTSGSGIGRRIVVTLAVLAGLALTIRDPVGAAHTVQQVAAWVGEALDALVKFGSALSGTSS
jgi:hypothetical protein